MTVADDIGSIDVAVEIDGIEELRARLETLDAALQDVEAQLAELEITMETVDDD